MSEFYILPRVGSLILATDDRIRNAVLNKKLAELMGLPERQAAMADSTRQEIDEGTGISELPRIGRLVRDGKGRVGRYMGKGGPYAMLRPVGGGKEWETNLEGVEPLTDAETLSMEVKETNARSDRRQA